MANGAITRIHQEAVKAKTAMVKVEATPIAARTGMPGAAMEKDRIRHISGRLPLHPRQH